MSKRLKRVCFWLSEEAALRLNGTIEKLVKELAAHGLKAEVSYTHFAGGADGVCSADSGEQQAESLYLTDRPDIYAALRKKGRYVLPYYHEHNCSASFPGAVYAVERLEETDYASFDMAYRRLSGLPWDILETGRLWVRETTVEDVDSFYRIYGNPSVTAYMEDLCADKDEEIAYTKHYIETVYAFYGYGMWTILEKESDEVVGRAGISWREGFTLPELGFMIGVPWQGRGYAFEVCSAILAYAKEELQMERMQALVQPGNEKSLGLCRRLGFMTVGETKIQGERHLVLEKEL